MFLIALFFSGCEKEETIITDESIKPKEEEPQNRFLMKSLNYEEVTENTKLVENLEKIKIRSKTKKKSNNYSKDVYNTTYNFTVNTDYVNYLEDSENNTHSYNFPITRNNPENDYIENLSLQLNEDGNYDAYIISYGFTPDEIDRLDENEFQTTETTLTPIDFDVSTLGDGVFSKVEIIPVYTYTWTLVEGGGGGGCDGCYTGSGRTTVIVINNPKQAPNAPQGPHTTGSGSTGSGGGSGSTTGSGGVIASPTISKPEYIINCNSNLLEIEGATAWLSDFNNRAEIDSVYDYLNKNSCSDEAKEFT